MKDVSVTVTLDDIKLYDRARAIGLPSTVVSMHGNKLKTLLAEERNATLEEIAAKIGKMPFGDTAASFAVWIREQKT